METHDDIALSADDNSPDGEKQKISFAWSLLGIFAILIVAYLVIDRHTVMQISFHNQSQLPALTVQRWWGLQEYATQIQYLQVPDDPNTVAWVYRNHRGDYIRLDRRRVFSNRNQLHWILWP